MFDRSCRVDVALRTPADQYVTALNGAAGWYLAGVARRVLGWENFTLLRLSPEEVALKTAHGTYVTAFGQDHDYFLRGCADRIRGWEIFRPRYLVPGEDAFSNGPSREIRLALSTHLGLWVRACGAEQSYRLQGSSIELKPECILTLRIL